MIGEKKLKEIKALAHEYDDNIEGWIDTEDRVEIGKSLSKIGNLIMAFHREEYKYQQEKQNKIKTGS